MRHKAAERAKDINPGADQGDVQELTGVGETLFFSAAQAPLGRNCGRPTGTESGTAMIKNLPEDYYYTSLPRHLTDVGGTLFFTVDWGRFAHDLWKSDGTEVGHGLGQGLPRLRAAVEKASGGPDH